MTVLAELTRAELTYTLRDVPDVPHNGPTMLVPGSITVDYAAEGPHLSRVVTIDGTARLKGGAVGSAKRWVRYEANNGALPDWADEHVHDQIPEGLPGGLPSLRIPGLQVTAPAEDGEPWSAQLAGLSACGVTRQEAKDALAHLVLAALATSATEASLGSD